jgi:hypothetical protein
MLKKYVNGFLKRVTHNFSQIIKIANSKYIFESHYQTKLDHNVILKSNQLNDEIKKRKWLYFYLEIQSYTVQSILQGIDFQILSR